MSAALTAALLCLALLAWPPGARAQTAAPVDAPAPALEAGPASPAPAAPAAEVPLLSPESELVLEVRLDRQLLSDGLTGFQHGDDVLLPLEQLAQLLTLAVRSDPEAGRAEGFILREGRSFWLDLPTRTVRVEGRSSAFSRGQVVAAEDDLYVAASLLNQWFPVTLEFDLPALALLVTAREPLPVQQRLQRERQASLLRRGRPERGAYREQRSPYRWLERPNVDATLSGALLGGEGDGAASGDYALFMTADLLKMEGSLQAIGGSRGAGELRAALARHDPEGRLLGPLSARSLALGSVSIPGLPNLSRTAVSGYGLALGNYPLSLSSAFGQQSLQGPLPPGWDVELYYNDVLIGFQAADEDGLYEFSDLPLLHGVNQFRLVFHGPQGQLRVEQRHFLLEESVTPPGELRYRLAAHNDEDGGNRALLQVDAGLSRYLSLSTGASAVPLETGDERYRFAGLRALWGPVIVNTDVARSASNGRLLELGLRSRFRRVAVQLQRIALEDFVSEIFPASEEPVDLRHTLRFDGYSTLRNALPLGWRVEWQQDELATDRRRQEGNLRLGTYWRGTSLTQQLRVFRDPGGDSTEGLSQFSRRVAGTGLRAAINYRIDPDRTLTAVAASADRALSARYALNLTALRDLVTRQSTFSASINKHLGAFALGLSSRYRTDDSYALEANLFISFGKAPDASGWNLQATPRADTGSLLAEVFVDENANGQRDRGEPPVAGAQFFLDESLRPQSTNDAGYVTLERLSPRAFSDVGLDPASLEDPQWQPAVPGYRVLPRPGHLQVLAFPVLRTSEIEGTVYRTLRGRERPAARVLVELRDRSGKAVKQSHTAADGFYILDGIPPGEYRLVLPEFAAEQGARAERPVRVGSAGEVLRLDFRLGAAPAP